MSQFVRKVINLFEQSTLGIAVSRFTRNETVIYAAGLTFYAIFSLFPLLLVLVSIGSFILEKYLTADELSTMILGNFPLYHEWIKTNLMDILEKRGAIGIVGIVSLVWSASGYFNTLVRAMNYAWPGIKPRGFVKRRLVAIAIIAAILAMLIISFVSSSTISLLSHFQVPMGGSIKLYNTFIWKFFKNYFPYISTLIIFWLLYFITPNVKVKKRAALIGAFPASIVWNLLNKGFTLFLSSGFVRYEIVYGSLSTIVSFLFWIYLTNLIVLFGAYISASAQYKMFPQTIPNGSNSTFPPA
jgi:membrane protein